jgi:hypothetical protein
MALWKEYPVTLAIPLDWVEEEFALIRHRSGSNEVMNAKLASRPHSVFGGGVLQEVILTVDMVVGSPRIQMSPWTVEKSSQATRSGASNTLESDLVSCAGHHFRGTHPGSAA